MTLRDILDIQKVYQNVLATGNATEQAKAIEIALPKPFPAPVTTAYLFFKLYFFKYILYE